MLYEIQCDKFAETIDGKRIPRGTIRFHDGLNTVLGDKKAENSIGKSTFLLAIDFCFGGDDYVDVDKNNVVSYVGHHTIKFALKFADKIERYSRNTLTQDVVAVCDENYNETGENLSIEDFRKHLLDAYRIKRAQNSWRSLVGRYARIYGKHNDDEEAPLKYGDETVELAIQALQRLFGVYDLVKGYEDYYKEKNKRKTVRKSATDIGEITTIATTKKQVKENEKEIERLQEELENLQVREDTALADQDTENLDKAAEIRGQITVLRRRRSRLVSQLNAVKTNLAGGLTPTSDDIIELKEYFHDVDIEKLETVEAFHRKMQRILTTEMTEEVDRLEALISEATDEVRGLEAEQRELGIPTSIPKKFIEDASRLKSRIAFLQKQNEMYDDTQELKAETKAAKERMEEARESELQQIETAINQEMVRLNDFIYDGARYAPEIHFSNTRSGKPAYTFKCRSNTGTGENYKNLIIFDLSILKETELPILVHDSLIFKNIADLPIDKIMQIYMKSKKQIFISFDKQEAYTEFTAETVKDTRVIDLYENGGELFGWSWAIKDKKEQDEEN